MSSTYSESKSPFASQTPPQTVIETYKPPGCSCKNVLSCNGALKIITILFTLLAVIFCLPGVRKLYNVAYISGTANFTLFAASTGSLTSFFVLLLTFCRISVWPILETAVNGLLAVSLATAGGIMIPYHEGDWTRMAAAVCAFVAAAFYGIDFCDKLVNHCKTRPKAGAAHSHVQFENTN